MITRSAGQRQLGCETSAFCLAAMQVALTTSQPTARSLSVPATVELAAGAYGVMHLPVRVVHATLEENGRWIIGCAFATPLTEEDLQDFFDV